MKTAGRLERLLASGRFVVTAEAGPPRGADPEPVRRKAAQLKGFVDACNVTDNQRAMVRMSSLVASKILLDEGVEPVMQMTCRDRNRIAMQSDILGASALGISNLLCLSGDHQSFGDHPGAKNVFDLDSIQLIAMARKMRDEGLFESGQPIKSGVSRLLVGAVENPFGEPREIRVPRLAKKVEAGAEFIQTQSIFNVERFAEWMGQVRDRGLHERVYILAGISPLKSSNMAVIMATKVPGMEVPEAILTRMAGVPKEEQKAEGLRIAVETIERIRDIPGVAGVHVMAIEWEDAVADIVRRAGLMPRPEP